MNSRWRNLTLWVFSYLSFLLASMNEKFTCMKALISKGCIFISFVSFPCNGEHSPEEGNLRVRCAPFRFCNYSGKQIEWSTPASHPDVSLSRWKCARTGRREGDNGRDVVSPAVFTLPMVPCGSSPVTRVSRSPLRREKRSAWGEGWVDTLFHDKQPTLLRSDFSPVISYHL